MGFPSPATDYVENRLSLDELCNTRAPSVYIFRACTLSRRAGIIAGALLVVNSALKPVDGSIIAARLNGEFRLVRYRTVPILHFEELEHPDRRLPMAEDVDMDGGGAVCFGVVTHVLNDVRSARVK